MVWVVDGLNARSSEKIYQASWPSIGGNPLIIDIAQLEDLDKIAEDVPDGAKKLAEKYIRPDLLR